MENDILELKTSIVNQNVVFFAGSGISTRAGLPSVSEIMNLTCDKMLCHILDEDRKFILEIQPELFYSVLLEGSDYKADGLSLWGCLHPSLWEKYIDIGYRPSPTIEHLFMVSYSFISGVPIFTTNYDTMFEDACNMEGIPYKTLIFSDNPGEVEFEHEKKVFICKIHGDIYRDVKRFDLNALKTTMESITQKNEAWIDFILKCLDKYDFCFCGYSGRDIDYYPFIKEHRKNFKSDNEIFWLQRYNKIRSDIENITISNAENIGAKIVNGFPSDIFPVILADVFCEKEVFLQKIDHIVKNTHPPSLDRKKSFIERVKKDYAVYRPECNQIDWEEFIVILVYLRTGKIKNARFRIDGFLSKTSIQNYPLWMQKKIVNIDMMICREQCKLGSYRKKAFELLTLAKVNSDTSMIMNAKLQIIGSYQLGILFNVGFQLPIYLRGYFKSFFVMTMYYIWLHEFSVYEKREKNFLIENRALYEEGKVRFYGLLTGLTLKLNLNFLKSKLKKELIDLYEDSYKYGNYISVIGACKYLMRIGDDSTYWKEKGEELSNMVSEKSALSIFERGEEGAVFIAEENDNVLNVIKGYLALAKKRDERGDLPLLKEEEKKHFKEYEKMIEDKYLCRQIDYIKKHYLLFE